MLHLIRFMEKQSNSNNNVVTALPSCIFDELIAEAWFSGSRSVYSYLLSIVREGTMPVDYQHSRTGMTMLMAATIHGRVDVVKSAIASGANPTFLVISYFYYQISNV